MIVINILWIFSNWDIKGQLNYSTCIKKLQKVTSGDGRTNNWFKGVLRIGPKGLCGDRRAYLLVICNKWEMLKTCVARSLFRLSMDGRSLRKYEPSFVCANVLDFSNSALSYKLCAYFFQAKYNILTNIDSISYRGLRKVLSQAQY